MQWVDKKSIATAFSRAVQTYDQQANLQREVADHLIQQILQNHALGKILDAGCGTGYVAQKLKQNNRYHLTALDLSATMLNQAKINHSADEYVQGDIEALPLLDQSFDCVVSSLALQWCHSLQGALNELLRVLKSGGQLYVSTLLQPTLWELRQAWQTIDGKPHTIDFLSGETLDHHLTQLEMSGKLDYVSCHCYAKELMFEDMLTLLKSLQNIGATALPQRSKGLMGKGQLQALTDAYPRLKNEQTLSLTYYVAEIMMIKA